MKLRLENINFDISRKKIIQDISFEVKQGSFVGIIGPNGSGKSSMLKCIYGINKPSSGKIFFEGDEFLSMKRKERAKKIAVLAQETNEHFDFSVEQIVKMGRFPHKKTMEDYSQQDRQIVKDVLKKMDLEDYVDRSFSTLSGGEKQRVLIARVLAQGSDFIILDEPTNHLDIGHQIQIMNKIKAMGVTVLSAIHDMNIASLYCDEIIVMKKGRLMKKGTVEEIMTEETIKEVFNIDVEIHHNKTSGKKHICYKV